MPHNQTIDIIIFSPDNDHSKHVRIIKQKEGGQATLYIGNSWEGKKENEFISTPKHRKATSIPQHIGKFKNAVERIN